MSAKFEHLFSPIHIGSLALINRIAMAPMVTHLTDNGYVTPELISYYARRGEGGAGLIVLEAAYPCPKEQPGRLAVYNDKFLPGLTELVNTVHNTGAKVALEINPGRGRSDDVDPVSASEIDHPLTGIKARALSLEEIEQIIEDFGRGVDRTKRAGFDAVMIHGGHGYLVSEFLSPRINKRQDKYGGDLKGRARIALDLASITKYTAGKDYPVIFRVSASERIKGGISLQEAVQACRLIEEAGIDAIDIVSGATESMEWIVPYMSFPMGYNVDIAEAVKKAVNIPVMVAGRITKPEFAEEIIREEKTDLVDLGRALIADPDFPNKAAQHNAEDIRPCIGCTRCVESFLNRQPLVCTVNPMVGREGKTRIQQVSTVKKILVVGGGPAGMQAAITASLRGHTVTLWEQEGKLGGQMHLAGALDYKKEILSFLKSLERETEKLNIDVHLNTKASAESVMEFRPDALVIATGALPRESSMEAKSDKICFANNWEVMKGNANPGKNIVIIGGGLAGCEAAEMMVPHADSITIIEKLEDIANDTIFLIKKYLSDSLKEKNVHVICNVERQVITDDGVEIEDNHGQQHSLKADQIIFTTGSVPNTQLAEKIKNAGTEYLVIGDCKMPRRILEAIHEGAEAGLKI